MNDEQYFLANAYLDGELTDDERRIAEADPAVMAEVEVLRGLQAELQAVEPPSAESRESAIGAAMAAFAERDAAPATAAAAAASAPDPVSGAPVVPFRPKPAYTRFLGVAAAVVAVGLLGVVIVNGIGTGGDDDADMATVADEAAEESADRAMIESAGDDAADDMADAAEDDGGADEADAPAAELEPADDMEDADMASDADEAMDMSDEMSAEMSEDVASDDEMVEEMADDGDVAAAGGADLDPAYDSQPPVTERPDIDVEAPITNDGELGAFGTYLLELQIDGQLPPTPNTACDPIYNILDDAPVVVNGETDDRHIAVQEDEQRVIAIERDTCLELVDGPLFEPFAQP